MPTIFNGASPDISGAIALMPPITFAQRRQREADKMQSLLGIQKAEQLKMQRAALEQKNVDEANRELSETLQKLTARGNENVRRLIQPIKDDVMNTIKNTYNGKYADFMRNEGSQYASRLREVLQSPVVNQELQNKVAYTQAQKDLQANREWNPDVVGNLSLYESGQSPVFNYSGSFDKPKSFVEFFSKTRHPTNPYGKVEVTREDMIDYAMSNKLSKEQAEYWTDNVSGYKGGIFWKQETELTPYQKQSLALRSESNAIARLRALKAGSSGQPDPELTDSGYVEDLYTQGRQQTGDPVFKDKVTINTSDKDIINGYADLTPAGQGSNTYELAIGKRYYKNGAVMYNSKSKVKIQVDESIYFKKSNNKFDAQYGNYNGENIYVSGNIVKVDKNGAEYVTNEKVYIPVTINDDMITKLNKGSEKVKNRRIEADKKATQRKTSPPATPNTVPVIPAPNPIKPQINKPSGGGFNPSGRKPK